MSASQILAKKLKVLSRRNLGVKVIIQSTASGMTAKAKDVIDYFDTDFC